MLEERILVHYGELALKGRNRGQFERCLKENMRQRLKAEGMNPDVYRRHGALIVNVENPAAALRFLQEVPGIISLAQCLYINSTNDYEAIANATLTVAQNSLGDDASSTFAIDVKKSEKRVPWRAMELERLLGAVVLAQHPNATVNLTAPQHTIFVEIRSEGVYVYSEKQKGLGGMPVGSTGKVLALLSGGIDSPVAAFLMARRGAKVDFLHLVASHGLLESLENSPMAMLAQRLSCYMGEVTLYAAPYIYFDLMASEANGYGVVLFRRFIASVGEKIARKEGALALVSGDSLAQVASQTMENLVSTSQAVTMPIFRPLIALDKEEIIHKAKAIGTYEISILPYKDCCALLSANPRTRSYHAELAVLENNLFGDGQSLIDKTLADMRILCFAWGKPISQDLQEKALA